MQYSRTAVLIFLFMLQALSTHPTFYYILVHKSQQDAALHNLFYLTTALHVSGVTITHLQKHKTTVTTASGNRYTVIDRVKFTDKEYR